MVAGGAVTPGKDISGLWSCRCIGGRGWGLCVIFLSVSPFTYNICIYKLRYANVMIDAFLYDNVVESAAQSTLRLHIPYHTMHTTTRNNKLTDTATRLRRQHNPRRNRISNRALSNWHQTGPIQDATRAPLHRPALRRSRD